MLPEPTGLKLIPEGPWCSIQSSEQHGLTVATEADAETHKRLLEANGHSFEIAQHAILTTLAGGPRFGPGCLTGRVPAATATASGRLRS